ncbi:hypothetical protein ACFQ3Y_07680 [Paenibacillus motobuensis]|uniref:hypothetical protein n=1 Tax=Paenibacillus motobuensis TaxID=295324 RepID=UPI003643EC09
MRANSTAVTKAAALFAPRRPGQRSAWPGAPCSAAASPAAGDTPGGVSPRRASSHRLTSPSAQPAPNPMRKLTIIIIVGIIALLVSASRGRSGYSALG